MGLTPVISLTESIARGPLVEALATTLAITDTSMAIVAANITTRSDATNKRVDSGRAWTLTLFAVL
jgi:hypothetical protein